MSGYGETTLREHARIAILRFLDAAPALTSNVAMLADLLSRYGIGYTRDQVEGEVQWLKEQGLVATETLAVGLTTVTATVRGSEVAQGIARHPGVRRPSPGT